MIWLAFALLAYVGALIWRSAAGPREQRSRTLRRGLAPVVLAYLAILVMLMFFENRLLYYPFTAAEDWEQPSGPAIEDVWLSSDDGSRLHAWWFPVPSARWCVHYSHGNGGNLSHRQSLCREWQRLGASVLIYDYPGYGRNSGRPNEAGCQAAGRAAYDWLINEKKVLPDQLVLFGESLGCAMAVELAVSRPHRALVLYAPFTSIPDMAQCLFPWLPARWLVRSRYDNLAKINDYQGPLFIAHGTADRIIPFSQGQRLFEAAPPGDHKHFFPVRDHDHNDGLTSEVFEAIGKFLSGIPNQPCDLPIPKQP